MQPKPVVTPDESGDEPRRRPGIDQHSALPLYHQLFTMLRDAVYRGDFPEDGTLPGELALCEDFGVSRATVRRAVDELVNRGLVVREQGRGTRVRSRPRFSPIVANIDGLLERNLIIGSSTQVEILEYDEVPAPPEIAQILRLDARRLHMSTVVRKLEGQPFAHFTSWVPAAIGHHLSRQDLMRAPALLLLERKGILIERVEQTIAAEPATTEVARHLQVDPGAPLLRVERVVFAAQDTPVEWSVALYRHDRHQYRINLQALGSSVPDREEAADAGS